jgi:hypothetical protein
VSVTTRDGEPASEAQPDSVVGRRSVTIRDLARRLLAIMLPLLLLPSRFCKSTLGATKHNDLIEKEFCILRGDNRNNDVVVEQRIEVGSWGESGAIASD